MDILARNPDLDYVHPETEVYTGLWCLHAGATVFLLARLWTKLTRRHGMWWDDYILITTWVRKDMHVLAREPFTDHRVASPHNQRRPHKYRVQHRLREPSVGFSNAHTHRHYFLPHSAWPESLEDSFCSNIIETDQRRPVATMDFMVLHPYDERMEFGQGTIRKK